MTTTAGRSGAHGDTGDTRARVVTNSNAHNTIYGPDGRRVYLAGLKSPSLAVVDPSTGCSLEQVAPCDHARGQSVPWRNHGQYVSTFSCPLTVRNASLPKKSCVKSVRPPGPRGIASRLATSSVLTRNISPAPSASLAVMIGVWIQKKPCS